MLKNKDNDVLNDEESVETILENVFGESPEISPNLPDPVDQNASGEANAASNDDGDGSDAAPKIKKPAKAKKKNVTQKRKARKASEPTLEQSEPVETSGGPIEEVESEEDAAAFADLPLSPEVQQAVAKTGYTKPTPIQSEIIPHLLYGRDVVAQSQTGTGKTAAFALPILTRIETTCNEPQVLVLVPTRELAIQVAKSFETYGANLPGFQHAVIYGGQDYEVQFRQLRKGPQVIVGTPGRTIDHIKNGKLDISDIECLVLDEADEMLNMGFLEDVKFVLERAPDDRQIALFSATLPEPIRKISQRYLNDPAKVTIKQKTLTADSIRQRAVVVSPRDRVDMLVRFLEAEEADGAIVFTRTRETTSVVADKLTRAGLKAFALNGEMPQKARERTIEKLKSGHLDILVATDIAARGLDVSRISHVFNYDLPEGPEAYTHRIGRTGRAGKKGEAVIFVSHSQRGKLRFIEKITRQEIEIVDPPTAEQINKMRVKRFHATIEKTIAERDMTFFEKLVNDFLATSEQPAEKVAAAIAMMSQNGRDFLMKDRPVREPRNKDRKSKRSGGQPESGMARFRLSVGKQDGVRPGNIVGAITNEANLDGDDIGSIRINHSYTTIDLPAERAAEIMEALADTRVSGRAISIRPYEERNDRRTGGGKKRRFGSGGRGSSSRSSSSRRNAKPGGRSRRHDSPHGSPKSKRKSGGKGNGGDSGKGNRGKKRVTS